MLSKGGITELAGKGKNMSDGKKNLTE